MSKVFVDQTYLRIILTTNVNIANAQVTEIHYRKPDGTIGQLTAAVQDEADGVIYYDLQSDDTLLDQRGPWKFWAYVVFSDGRAARGEPAGVTIWDNEE